MSSRRLSALVILALLALAGGTPRPVTAHMPASDSPPASDASTFAADGAHLGGATLRLAALGRKDALAPVDPVTPTHDGPRVAYAHGDATEWYERQGGGIEQGMTLATPPPGDGPLALTVATPETIPMVDEGGAAATLLLPRGAGGATTAFASPTPRAAPSPRTSPRPPAVCASSRTTPPPSIP